MNLLTIRSKWAKSSYVIFAKLLALNSILNILESVQIKLFTFLTSVTKASLIIWTPFITVVSETCRIIVNLLIFRPDMLVNTLVTFRAFSVFVEKFTIRKLVFVQHVKKRAIFPLLASALEPEWTDFLLNFTHVLFRVNSVSQVYHLIQAHSLYILVFIMRASELSVLK